MTNDSTNGPATAERSGSVRCPGSGTRAILEPRSGFYGCPTCKTPQGVILRPGDYITPEHAFGETHREKGDTTFVLRCAEHANIPVLALAAQNGLPKDMVIDLLAHGLLRMQAEMVRMRETDATQPKIILTGIGDA